VPDREAFQSSMRPDQRPPFMTELPGPHDSPIINQDNATAKLNGKSGIQV